jgi:hypothetical protein
MGSKAARNNNPKTDDRSVPSEDLQADGIVGATLALSHKAGGAALGPMAMVSDTVWEGVKSADRLVKKALYSSAASGLPSLDEPAGLLQTLAQCPELGACAWGADEHLNHERIRQIAVVLIDMFEASRRKDLKE